jgi:hypothetical protein
MKHAMRELGFDQLDQVSGGRGIGGNGLGDFGMEKQLRLQMYMDAFSQSFAMLGNILTKSSDTAGQIAQNMK